VFLLDLRMAGDDVFVTIEALFHGGDPGKIGAPHKRVTEFTLDLFDP
jgi:hypothetical protein